MLKGRSSGSDDVDEDDDREVELVRVSEDVLDSTIIISSATVWESVFTLHMTYSHYTSHLMLIYLFYVNQKLKKINEIFYNNSNCYLF